MPGDIFLTFFGHFAEAQLDPRTFFLTFLGHFVGDPQNDPQDILGAFFRESRKTPVGTGFAHYNGTGGNEIGNGGNVWHPGVVRSQSLGL